MSNLSLSKSAIKYLILVSLLLTTFQLLARQTNRERIDSLLNDVIEHRHDSLKLRALAQLPARFWYNDLDSVEVFRELGHCFC